MVDACRISHSFSSSRRSRGGPVFHLLVAVAFAALAAFTACGALAATAALPAWTQEEPRAASGGHASASGTVLQVPQQVATLQEAIARVTDGGTIELAAGSYAAPAGGFRVSNLGKGFTIRAALGAAVALDGGGSQPVFVLRNAVAAHNGLIVFENLVFRNGFGGSSTVSPGVTIDGGTARFVGCSFANNVGTTGADGGGVKVRNGSTATFIGCSFGGNSSPIAGGAMMVNASSVEVQGGSFVGNSVNLPNSDPSSHGGAISVIDGTLLVSDALFQGNQAGFVGGAIIAFGSFNATPAVPASYVSVTRCTFLANAVAPQPASPPPGDPAGGAIHVEDQTTLDVAGSYFAGNQAQFGGALDSYRALINVSGSTFEGNGGNLSGTDAAVGGAICALSNDAVDGTTAGGQNPRPAAVTVAGSFLQGQAGGGAAANAGGCILIGGDQQHLYGLGGLAPNGTVQSNSAVLQVSGTVFDNCNIQASATAGGGQGGAIDGSLVELTMAGSLVLSSNAGANGTGGGVFINGESTANVSGTIFAGNTAAAAGGAFAAGDSDVQIGGSEFIANQVGAGAATPASLSRGAALYFFPLPGGQPHVGAGDASGLVTQTIFSGNLGLPVWDVDGGGASPVNTVQYSGNAFFNTTDGADVYVDTLADPSHGGLSVAALNALTVTRSASVTIKSPVANLALSGAPVTASLVEVPPAGSPGARSAPALAYAWSGDAATLNGQPLLQHGGVVENPAPGTYTLAIDGVPRATAAIAAPQCTSDPVLCLAGDRFHAEVYWQLADGERGSGHPVALTGDTGYFWFFDPTSVELMVKVIDGRTVNDRFWVFYGALSNVSYSLVVTDTVTGAVSAYVNPQGTLASVADTSAFLGTGNAPPAPPVAAPPPPPPAACAGGPEILCLDNRFRVRVTWRDSSGTASGTAVALTGDTGYFWFFDAADVDLVLKILDGRSINGDFWVFYGALSDVQYTITIKDTQTGRTKTYVNPQGTLASVADTSALRGP
jgi:hypothetical protein